MTLNLSPVATPVRPLDHGRARAWTSHPARFALPCLGVVLATLGLLAGRPELVVVATPLIIAAVWSLVRPQPGPVALAVTDKATRVTIASQAHRPVMRLRLACEGHRTTTVVIGPGRDQFELSLHCVRTGLQPTLRADWDLHGEFWLTASLAETGFSDPVVVLPSYLPLGLTPRSTQLRGLTGPRDSRRPGDGFELRDIHPMRPGDPQRRIDWRATARQPTMELWVRGALATGEPVAVLVMDSRDEVGPDLHTWRGAALRVDEVTSLDLARHAAASVARALIDVGDRVGLADLATGRRLLAPAAGARQLERLTYALALSAPVGSPLARVRPPQVPTDAIVYLFSTLLDDVPLRLARVLTATGHQVVVIDTLPQVRPVAEVNLEVAWRITAAERNRRVRALRTHHIPVIGWAGQARDQASQRLAEIHRAQRRVRSRP